MHYLLNCPIQTSLSATIRKWSKYTRILIKTKTKIRNIRVNEPIDTVYWKSFDKCDDEALFRPVPYRQLQELSFFVDNIGVGES